LVELAEALAADRVHPGQPGLRVKEATAALRRSGGEHVLLDAAAVLAYFTTMTIVVDSHGQRTAMFDVVEPVVSALVSWKRNMKQMLPLFAVVAALGAAAYMSRRSRLG